MEEDVVWALQTVMAGEGVCLLGWNDMAVRGLHAQLGNLSLLQSSCLFSDLSWRVTCTM